MVSPLVSMRPALPLASSEDPAQAPLFWPCLDPLPRPPARAAYALLHLPQDDRRKVAQYQETETAE